MLDKIQMATDLGLEYNGHDRQGHWFSFRGEEKRFVDNDEQDSLEQAAEWVLTQFYGYQK